jgi:ABC-type dipeptide/oligopeptide/nickel transport system permease subunit
VAASPQAVLRPRTRSWRLRSISAGDAGFGVFAAILIVMTVLAIWPGLVTSRDPTEQSLMDRHRPPGYTDDAGAAFPLGTDHLGRDLLSRLVFGARASLTVGFAGLALGAGAGVLIGLVAGYRGGYVDRITVGVIDTYLSFPYILIAIVWASLVGTTLLTLVLIVAVRGWVDFARVVRAQVLSVREREYVTAARGLGAGDLRILARHVLPNTAGSVLVIAGFQLGRLILLEATLSFLGLGIQPPTPAWGSMLADARLYVTQAWWTAAFPSILISLTVLSTNFVGDSLRDRLDPTLRGRI